MDELRPEMREAFANQQAELGDLVGTRERLIRGALDARQARGGGRMQMVAGIAMVLITVTVIGTFAYVRANTGLRHGPGPSSSPSASPAPITKALDVPDGTPVVLFHDPFANYSLTDAMTWDGKVTGTLRGVSPGYTPNPSANLFASATEIRDRSGRAVATGNFGVKYFGGTWADDGRQLCQMVPFDVLGANGVPATLQLVAPGRSPVNVAQVGKVYEQAVIQVAACSVRRDRAVVVQGFGNSPATAQYWVVELTTGKVLWTHQFDISSAAVTVVASPDAQYVAENTVGQTTIGATIYGPDGKALARLSSNVEGFCWDGTLVVTDAGYGSTPVKVLRWSDGAVVWSGPSGHGFFLERMIPEPDGARIAIGIRNPSYPVQSGDVTDKAGLAAVDLYVVAPDGHVVVEMPAVFLWRSCAGLADDIGLH